MNEESLHTKTPRHGPDASPFPGARKEGGLRRALLRASSGRTDHGKQAKGAHYCIPPTRRLPHPPNKSKLSTKVSGGHAPCGTVMYCTTGGSFFFFFSFFLLKTLAAQRCGAVRSCHEIRNERGAPCPLRERRGSGGPPPTVTRGQERDEVVAQMGMGVVVTTRSTFFAIS
ncbi:hypothetical protein H4582DRAFT_712232 [Lactarius indigo]|nr:hypothetical protein H4582DRAFT_712232 [Lactarius indigo]